MNKSLLNAVGIGILVIITISVLLTITGVMDGKLGDYIIMITSLVTAVSITIYIRRNKRQE